MNYKQSIQKRIKSAYKDGKNVYFIADEHVSYEELNQQTENKYNYIRVPNLIDEKALNSYTFSSKVYESMLEEFRKNGMDDTKILLEYKNQSAGFNRRLLTSHTMKDKVKKMSEKPAYIYHGGLEWEKVQYQTFSELFQDRKESKQIIKYISSKGESEQTYGQLYHSCMRMAKQMKNLGIEKGTKLVIQFDEKRDFVELFWSAMLVGAVIVSVAVLEDYKNKNVNAEKLNKICGIFEKPVIICREKLKDDLKQFKNLYDMECRVITMEKLQEGEGELEVVQNEFTEDEPCMFFFTSGSTGMPKGVGLTQRNVFARTLGEIQMYGFDEHIRDLNWMTLTHAAGAVWTMFRDIYLNAFQIQVSTEYILKDPIQWMELLHKYKITTSWAPNFAYALLGKCIDENVDYHWDLSNATNIYSTAETNVSKSLRMFLKKVKKYGFPEKGLIPCFGMTETSSVMAYYNDFSYEATSDKDLYVPMGTPQRGIEIRITDKRNRILYEGETGYLQIKGDTVLKEYYKNLEANHTSFTPDGFLITGDMAFIKGENVVITGREKNIIIVNGLNYYIEDMEEVAEDIEGVERGYTAFFSIIEQGQEEIILVFSPEDEALLQMENSNSLRSLLRKVKKEIQTKCFLTINHIIPIKKESFPREGIGKKQRNTLKEKYEKGVFDDILQRTEELQKQYVLVKSLTEILETSEQVENDNVVVDICFLQNKFNQEPILEENIEKVYEYVLQNIEKYTNISKPKKVIFPVLYQKEQFSWYRGILPSLLRTLAMENDNFSFKLLFLEQDSREIIEKECRTADGYEVVTYVNGKRYIDTYKTFNGVCKKENADYLFQGKLVIILGGLGGIGTLFSKYLLDNYKNIKLLIIGRREKEKVSEQLAAFPKKQVLYASVDVKDYEVLYKVCEETKRAMDAEIGCIFNFTARSVPKEEEMTIAHAMKNQKQSIYTESAKVKLVGLQNAEKIRKANDCKMYVLGSVTADFGMVNMSAYAVSNLLAEEYCLHLSKEKVIFIGSSGWNNIGMNLKKNSADMKEFLNHFNTDKNGFLEGFTDKTGVAMLENIITSGVGSCFSGVNHEFRGLQYCIADPFEETIHVVVQKEEQIGIAKKVIDEKYSDYKRKIVFRMDQIKYIVNSKDKGKMEQEIKRIWEENLSHEIKSLDDNLFDIGGNSLIVFKITDEIKKAFAVEVNPIDVMTNSTIRSFSEFLCKLSLEENTGVPVKEKAKVRKRKLKTR